jgi:hypothetical protein
VEIKSSVTPVINDNECVVITPDENKTLTIKKLSKKSKAISEIILTVSMHAKRIKDCNIQ